MVTSIPAPNGQTVNLPAVCGTCGRVFPSGFTIAGGGSYHLSNNQAGPCPGCGGMGRIPDGVIDLNQPDVVAALRAMADLGSIHNLRRMIGLLPRLTTDELFAVRQTLTSGAAGRSEEQVVQDVQRAAPRLATAADLIRNRDNRMELAIWLTLIAAIIPIVIALKANHQEVTPPRQDQIIQVIVPTPSAIPATPSQTKRHRTGRNEPCPCGSGMKFKRCHDSPTARP
jgi:hypothetical protein